MIKSMRNERGGAQGITVEIEIGSRHPRREPNAVPRRETAPRLPRITRLMALAIKLQDMVDRGEVLDYADIARLGYVTRARITQVMNLLHLAPEVQEEILFLSSAPSERSLRPLTVQPLWDQQIRLWRQLKAEKQVTANCATPA